MIRFAFLALVGVFANFASADDHDPIPQDAALISKNRNNTMTWYRKTMMEAYAKVGKTDPKWDEAAKQAIDLAIRISCYDGEPPPTSQDAFAAAKKAIDAGCDDPIVLNLYAVSSQKAGYPGAKEYKKRLHSAAVALEKSEYPPCRRVGPMARCGI